jgi:hypothetical protein
VATKALLWQVVAVQMGSLRSLDVLKLQHAQLPLPFQQDILQLDVLQALLQLHAQQHVPLIIWALQWRHVAVRVGNLHFQDAQQSTSARWLPQTKATTPARATQASVRPQLSVPPSLVLLAIQDL